MSVPSVSKMSKDAQEFYGQALSGDGEEYLDALFSNVARGWKSWQDSLSWGGLVVKGSGMGAWSGSGQQGKLQSSAQFVLPDFVFKENSPEQVKYSKGLGKALTQKFGAYPQSFKFDTVNYTGTSGATDKSPGPVSASNVDTPIFMAGKGQNPSGIADLWKSFLLPPDFQLDDPQAKGGELLKAIAKTIEQSFQSVWLVTTMFKSNTISTTGLPGGVVAGFTSPTNGKLM